MAKRTLPYVDAFALGTLRYAFGIALFLALLIAVEGAKALRYEGRALAATLYGLAGVTGFNLLVWIGLVFTRPEHAAIILALQSPLTAVAVWLVRGQRPPAFTIGCVAVAIIGVLLVVTKGDPAAAIADFSVGGALFGDVLVFCGAIAWVAYTLAAGQFTGWSALRLTVLTCIPGFIGLIGANAVAVGVGWATIPTLGAVDAVAWQLVYFSVCTVVLGVLGFNNATRRLGPLNTMLMLNIVPVLVFGIEAALGRRFSPVELLGAVTVVGALIANSLYLHSATIRT